MSISSYHFFRVLAEEGVWNVGGIAGCVHATHPPPSPAKPERRALPSSNGIDSTEGVTYFAEVMNVQGDYLFDSTMPGRADEADRAGYHNGIRI